MAEGVVDMLEEVDVEDTEIAWTMTADCLGDDALASTSVLQ